MCPKLCLNLSAPIQSLSLSVFVYVCPCAYIAYGVYLYVCLVESRCLSRKHTPSPTNAHNPLNDMQQSLNTNPLSVTAGREATTSVMWSPEGRNNESIVNKLILTARGFHMSSVWKPQLCRCYWNWKIYWNPWSQLNRNITVFKMSKKKTLQSMGETAIFKIFCK